MVREEMCGQKLFERREEYIGGYLLKCYFPEGQHSHTSFRGRIERMDFIQGQFFFRFEWYLSYSSKKQAWIKRNSHSVSVPKKELMYYVTWKAQDDGVVVRECRLEILSSVTSSLTFYPKGHPSNLELNELLKPTV